MSYSGTFFNVEVSYHIVFGVDGYVAGLKFSDRNNSTDAAKAVKVNPFGLGRLVAQSAIKMILPDLDKISIFGFYLLTDDLDTRRRRGSEFKKRVYTAKAIDIHKHVKHRLKHISRIEVEGGMGWAMSTKDFPSYSQFKVFERELAKQLEVIPC
ncbi:hypothetical protein [Microbulbifer sp. ZKSA002]|uniref:hypothetical protein n=1 Tax=Microbulbifer sp. ZKSA002 TaxID=3243388 RepID=UPI004039D982